MAVEYEKAKVGLNLLKESGIRLSKIHLSSALRIKPNKENLTFLHSFVEKVYLHQVVVRKEGKLLKRYKDLDIALKQESEESGNKGDEWRIHFHIPLHASPEKPLRDTKDHVLETLDWLAENPSACRHLEMETYTWEVLPKDLQSDQVVDQVAREYDWTLKALKNCGLGRENH